MKIAYITVQENIFMGNILFMGYPIYISFMLAGKKHAFWKTLFLKHSQ